MRASSDKGNRILRARLLAALVAALLLLLVGAAATTAAQETDIDFLVEPAPGSQLAEGGGYFVLPTEPGSQVQQTLALRNDSSRALPLRLQAVDATTGPYGGASYGLPGDTPSEVGTWIDLDRSSLTLPPGGSELVDFRVNVPAEAESGQHLAGLAIWSPAVEDTGEAAGEDEAGASIQVQTRRVIAVQVELPGPARAELVVSGVEPAARPDGLYFEIGIANVGTALTKGRGEIEVASEDFFEVFDIDTFVPGTEIAYPVQWARSVPEGEYDARVLVEYEGGEATWEGTVVVGEGVSEELADRGIDVPGGFPILPVAVVAAALVIIAATAWWLLRRRRRRPSPPTRRTTPSPSPTPQPQPARVPVSATPPPASSGNPGRPHYPTSGPPPPPPPPSRGGQVK